MIVRMIAPKVIMIMIMRRVLIMIGPKVIMIMIIRRVLIVIGPKVNMSGSEVCKERIIWPACLPR